MAENKMEKVAALLGIKLDEEFKVKGHSYKYKLIKNGLKYFSDISSDWERSCNLEYLLAGEWEIVKLPKPILDDVEKEYLSNVIKPFKDRVNYIIKTENSLGEYIAIHLRLYTCWRPDVTLLPEFEKGTMYKGMEINKRYNLEELGL